MSDITLIWLSTALTTFLTTILFVLLAQWSAGGPAPWSVAGGLARGIADWGHEAEATPEVSPRAVELPRLEVDERAIDLLRHPPRSAPEPQAEIEELDAWDDARD